MRLCIVQVSPPAAAAGIARNECLYARLRSRHISNDLGAEHALPNRTCNPPGSRTKDAVTCFLDKVFAACATGQAVLKPVSASSDGDLAMGTSSNLQADLTVQN